MLVNDPLDGFYRTKLVKGGPWVPVRIWTEDGDRCEETGELLSDQIIRCRVGGQDSDPFAVWTYCAGSPITEAEYDFMLANAEWCRDHAPEEPEANPRQAVDIDDLPPIF